MSSSSGDDRLNPGTRLGRYELICPLARGGMATVWIAKVHDVPGFDQWVAVKTILPQFADDPTFQSMFIDEARISSQIRHPNVAAVFDVGDDDGTLYLAMEWVDGDSWSKLHNAAKRNGVTVPMNITLRLATDTCAGLHAAHELRSAEGELQHVVHRDVSPQNVLIGTHGYAKLIDFGVAKAVDRLANETTAGTVKGKVFYCAPEQALGKAVDRRADVYSVGAVLYKMLTGRLPFEAENELAMLHLLMSGATPTPLPPSTPASVAAVVNRALQRDPTRRFNTTLHMQQALEAAISEPTGAAEVAQFVQQHLGAALDERRRNFDAVAAALLASPGAAVDLARVFPPTLNAQTGSIPSARGPASSVSVSMVTPSALSAFSAISTMQVGDSTAAPALTPSQSSLGLSKVARVVIAAGAVALLGTGVVLGASVVGHAGAASPEPAASDHPSPAASQAASTTAGSSSVTAPGASDPKAANGTASASPTSSSPTPGATGAASNASPTSPTSPTPSSIAPGTSPKTPTPSNKPLEKKKPKPDDGF